MENTQYHENIYEQTCLMVTTLFLISIQYQVINYLLFLKMEKKRVFINMHIYLILCNNCGLVVVKSNLSNLRI